MTATATLPQARLYRWAYAMSIFTIVYNIAEGLVSVYFGIDDETLTLFGFGVDSFIETISGAGVAYMIHRVWAAPQSPRAEFETTALRITGYAFYALAVSLLASAGVSLWLGHRPETTLPGIVISCISMSFMFALIYGKITVGRKLGSAAIVADAKCALVCVYMSGVLLLSSAVYHFTHFAYTDVLGALGIVYFSVQEGRECFEKIKGMSCQCH